MSSLQHNRDRRINTTKGCLGRIGAEESHGGFVTHQGATFWNAKLYIDNLKKGTEINGRYCVYLLDRLNDYLRERPPLKEQKCSFIETVNGRTYAQLPWLSFTNRYLIHPIVYIQHIVSTFCFKNLNNASAKINFCLTMKS